MKNIRIGVIGIGNMGGVHARNIYDGKISGLCLSAVCDINLQKLENAQISYPEIARFSDYKTLIDSDTVDAVIVATPHPVHAEICGYALRQGVHVLCEKPIDIAVSKAIQLNRVAENSERVFAIMFNQRTDYLFQKAKELVFSDDFGEIRRTSWVITNWYRTQNYYNSADWRATWKTEGGGVLINQAPHNLDLWQWICGVPIEIIASCDVGKYHNIEVEDDVTIFARYKNGATGTFITSTGEFPGTNRFEIVGDRGKIVLEHGILKHWRLKQSTDENIRLCPDGFANIDFDYEEIPACAGQEAHEIILQNFADAIRFNAPLIAPGIEGINELMISNAAYLSAFNGNARIPIPFPEKEFNEFLAQKQQQSRKKVVSSSPNSNENHSVRWKVQW